MFKTFVEGDISAQNQAKSSVTRGIRAQATIAETFYDPEFSQCEFSCFPHVECNYIL